MLTFLSRTRTTRLLVSSSVRLPFSLVVSPREAPILTFVVPPPFPSFLSSRLQSLLRLSSTQINPSSTPNVVNQNLAQTNGAAAEGGELTREQIYPHTRPAPRLAPVVHLGAAPIPGGGRWSGVQTGAGGMLLPPPGTPEGKPGVIGPGVYKGSEWNLLKWEITERGLHWKVPGLMAIALVSLFLLWNNDKPFTPPVKPAGNYSVEEEKLRQASHKIRLAEISAREKAAALKAEAIAAESSLSGKLESAKEEMQSKIEDLGERVMSSGAEQLAMLSEKYDSVKTKA